MRRRARPLFVFATALAESLFAENERRTALFLTFAPHDYEGADAEQRARCYVKFAQDENDTPASATDFDVVLAPGQSLSATSAFLELPKGPVSVFVQNPSVIAEKALLVMVSEHSFETVPALYDDETFIRSAAERPTPGDGYAGRPPSAPRQAEYGPRGEHDGACVVRRPDGSFCVRR